MKKMSTDNKLISLLRQSYGTSNLQEAATFLSSAIGRVLKMEKEARRAHITEALKGVDLRRDAGGGMNSKPKTVYKDTKATQEKLAKLEATLQEMKAKYHALLNDGPQTAEENTRLKNRIAELQKSIENQKSQHFQELALLRQHSSNVANASELAALQQQLEDFQELSTQLSDECEQHKTRLKTLEATLEDKTAQVARLKKVMAEVAAGDEANETNVHQLELELANAQEALAVARKQNEEYNDKLLATLDSHLAANHEIDELNAKLVAALDFGQVFADEADHWKNAHDQKYADYEELQRRAEQTQTEVQSKYVDEHQRYKAASRKIDSIIEEKDGLHRQITHVRSLLKFEEQKSSDLSRQLSAARLEMTSMTDDLAQEKRVSELYAKNIRELHDQLALLKNRPVLPDWLFSGSMASGICFGLLFSFSADVAPAQRVLLGVCSGAVAFTVARIITKKNHQ